MIETHAIYCDICSTPLPADWRGWLMAEGSHICPSCVESGIEIGALPVDVLSDVVTR